MFTKLLLLVSYFLDRSSNYGDFKEFCKNLLDNDRFYLKKYFDAAMIIIVISTVAVYIYDIKSGYGSELRLGEKIAIAIFILEYLLRLWVHSDIHTVIIEEYEESEEFRTEFSLPKVLLKALKPKISFILNPISVIDLLAIHPELRPIRLFKLFRYSKSTRELLSILAKRKFELGVLVMMFSFTIFISSTIFYAAESGNKHVQTYFDAVYWSVITVATVGYGDIIPTTTEGRLTAIFLVFFGLGLIAILTSVVTAALVQKLYEVKERRYKEIVDEIEDFILICGYSLMTESLAKKLKGVQENFIIVDSDESRVFAAKAAGFHAFVEDATDIKTLTDIGVEDRAKAVICMADSDMTNISISLAARYINQKITIIAKVNQVKNEKKFYIAGVDHIINVNNVGGDILAQFYLRPIAFEAIRQIMGEEKNVAIEEIKLPELKKHSGFYTEIFQTHPFGCIMVGLIKSGGSKFYFAHHALEAGIESSDIIVVAGRPKSIEGLRLKIVKESI